MTTKRRHIVAVVVLSKRRPTLVYVTSNHSRIIIFCLFNFFCETFFFSSSVGFAMACSFSARITSMWHGLLMYAITNHTAHTSIYLLYNQHRHHAYGHYGHNIFSMLWPLMAQAIAIFRQYCLRKLHYWQHLTVIKPD